MAMARVRTPCQRTFFTGKSPREKMNYKRPLPVWTVDKTGYVQREELSKHAVLEEFPSVFARDLRTLDDRRRMISEILVREHALVFKVEHLRIVVSRSRAVIFDGDQPVVAAFAAKLGEELADTLARGTDAAGMVNVAAALELSVLECVLAAVAENFEHRFSLLDTITRQLLRNVSSQSFDEAAERLVPVKRSIATLHTALDEYRAALAAVVSVGMMTYALMRGRYFRVRALVAPSVAIFNQINSPGAVFDLFREAHLDPTKTRELMQTALGRTLTDTEFERAQLLANKDDDPHLSVAEVLRYLQELGDKDSAKQDTASLPKSTVKRIQ